MRTRPVGRKKLVPKCRSKISMMQAAMRAGKASRPSTATRNIAQSVIGIRKGVRPFARRLMIVVTKFRPPIVKEAMKNTIPTIQNVWPVSDPGTAAFRADSGG